LPAAGSPYIEEELAPDDDASEARASEDEDADPEADDEDVADEDVDAVLVHGLKN
jgi:hypothetical protein